MLASGSQILSDADRRGCAVGGFDVFNMESAQAVVSAAEEAGVPVFLQICLVSLEHTGVGYGLALAREAARAASVPICVHLDHGPEVSDVNQLKECMEAGFNSVMVDGSKLGFQQNVSLTRRVVEMARPLGICVEGEVGQVSRDTRATREALDGLMTDADEAARFVEATGIDYLAVSVGSVSGFYQGRIELNLERLRQIRAAVPVPLVFHGGTTIPEDQLKAAVRCGVRKVNIGRGLRKAFWEPVLHAASRETDLQQADPRRILSQGRDGAREYVKMKISQLSSP